MLTLPEVTLCCVDTRTPALGLEALARCRQGVAFGATLLFTDLARLNALLAALPDALPNAAQASDGVTLIDLQIDSVPAYSEFMLRGLARYVRTSHVLVVQWDGFVVDPACWDPAFLAHDYIGAPWPGITGPRAVGNGGFSLRSAALLRALQDPALAPSHPEDLCICHQHRDALESRHGMRFAPPALAARFAYERVAPDGPTFGVHGLFNLHRVLDAAALHDLVGRLPDAMVRGLDAHDLCRTLIGLGRLDTAALLLDKRRRQGMIDRRTLRLAAQLWWARRGAGRHAA